jgi:hypothetical protein
MPETATLGRFILLLSRLPSERIEALSDFMVALVSERGSDWRKAAEEFKKRTSCFVKVDEEDLSLYSKLGSTKNKIYRMLNSVIEILPSPVLSHLLFIAEGLELEKGNKWGRQIRNILDSMPRTAPSRVLSLLCFVAERMASGDGDQWCRELRRLLSGEIAWESPDPPIPYLHFDSGLLYGETHINVYERRRAGTNKETFESLRGGDPLKVCFSSQKMGVWFCNHFRNKLCAIPDNKVVLFLFHNTHLGTYVAYADMNMGGSAEAISFPLEKDSWVWTPKDKVRRIVLACERR